MTKNEYIASIMLEAADLLKNDSENLNESTGSIIKTAIAAVAMIDGVVLVAKNAISDSKRVIEQKKNLPEQKLQKYITSLSKETLSFKNKEDVREAIVKDIRLLVKECNKSSKVKKEIQKSFKEYFDENSIKDKNHHNFKGLYVDETEDCIKIINGTSDDCVALFWVVENIREILIQKWKRVIWDFKMDIDYGYNEEGCIRVE